MNWRVFFRDLGIYAAAIALPLVIAFGMARLPICHPEVVAAWFQGFGTVTAFVGAAALAVRSENNARMTAWRARHTFLTDISTLCVAAQMTAIELRRLIAVDDQDGLAAQRASGYDLHAQFEKWAKLPIQHWPLPSLSVSMDRIGGVFGAALSAAATVRPPGTPAEERAAYLDPAIAALAERLESFAKLVAVADKR